MRDPDLKKHAGIMRAALQVFVREGYTRASVDKIAEAARVSKRTIYDYFGSKRQLFLQTLQDTMEQHTAAVGGLLDRYFGEVTDLERTLTHFGTDLALRTAKSQERTAVMRLMIAEVGHFPALIGPPKGGTVQSLLAERLAALGERGLLDVPDPMEAAEFFELLVAGRVNHRSWYGAVNIDYDEIAGLVAGGVRVFLRAYGR